MSELNFQRTYAEEERRDYIARATIGTFVSIPLNLFCLIMDYYMYAAHPDYKYLLPARIISVSITAFVWFWYKTPMGKKHPHWGCAWYLSPLLMILWMIYLVDDGRSYYYAGLNIILVGMGLLTPWAYLQNLLTSVFVVGMYLYISLAMVKNRDLPFIMNNATFILITGVLVVSGSMASAKLRMREFRLRWDLDISRNQVQDKNNTLDRQNKELEDTIQKLTEAESQLVQSEKMASLGRMSAGIIHEINNPLNFATTGIFTLKKKAKHVAAEQQEEYNEILKDVEDGITRVKNIVSDLRMFTHPNSDNLDDVNAAETVASALRFLSNEMKDKATIQMNLTEQQSVRANKNKLIHVFVNLIQNSLDAMKEKPFPNGEKPTIWIEGRDGAEASCLIVRDNGPGITSEHVDKIFDPFYTTKDVGAGMGLGLSICYRIMQECQGKISVRTEPGKFCEFTLEFPKQTKLN